MHELLKAFKSGTYRAPHIRRVYPNGVPIESASSMLGHTNIKTTQHYAKTLDIKVSQDMARLKKKYRAA